MATMTRVQQLNAAVDRVKHEHDRWQTDPTTDLKISEGMITAIEEMLEAFHVGPCPPSHLKLHNAVVKFEQQVFEWREQATGENPNSGYWRALGEVFSHRKRLDVAPPAPMRSCKTLRQQGMTDHQIAFDVYGFRTFDGKNFHPESERYAGPLLTETGQLDPQKLEQEIEEPWSVIPKDWVSPRKELELREVGYYDQSPAVGKVQQTPEQLQERAINMLKGGGTVMQIADVCKMTTDEVVALADKEGIPLPDFTANDDPSDPKKERAAILEAHATGMKPDQIVNTLRAAGMKRVNLGRVKAVLQSAQPIAVAAK